MCCVVMQGVSIFFDIPFVLSYNNNFLYIRLRRGITIVCNVSMLVTSRSNSMLLIFSVGQATINKIKERFSLS